MSKEPRFTTLIPSEIAQAVRAWLEKKGVNIDEKVFEMLFYDKDRKQVHPDRLIVITDTDPGFIPGTTFKDE